ncbi:GntR family transcriptional regulator [Sinorhizobium fredii]|uniref:GntR family transcriptional regulator n=1 Tax=Rhizobium fredii TaxID=380 RepID=UPI0005956C9D|nr:GntR family transcriptional regulator [Sinorhizobium fredii]UTY47309.1 GntR family transcriptional regulator [Sinorhizobium fredii]WOS65999.1 GntR family transcriptional regulator [Sinorhizobium fredii GR64]
MKKLSSLYDRSRVPLYLQVASVMRHRIDTGHWLEGDKISTLEELESEFGVARVTIRQAIELLRDEGLLDAQQGRGTFVSGKPKHNRWLNLANDFDTVVASIKDNVIERVHIEENVSPPDLVEGEGILADGYVFLRSIQYNHGEPFSAVNLFLAQHIFDRDRKRFAHSAALPMIVEMKDVMIAHAHQTLTIGVADPDTAEQLKIGLGEPTADCRLVLVDESGIAIYVADIHYRKDCFALRVDLLDRVRDHGKILS